MSNTQHAEPAREAQGERQAVTVTEAIVPAVGIAFSIYYLSTIWTMPFEARMGGMLISAVIFLLTAVLAIRWTRDAIRHGVETGWWALLGEGRALARRLAVLALTVAYVLVLPKIGYFVATLAFLAAAMATLGVRRPVQLALVPLVTTLVGHLVFIIVLGISLPTGVVGEFLSPLRQAVGL